MNKLILCYIILFCSGMYSQNKILFTEINRPNIDLSKSFKSYQILQINDNFNSISNGEKLTLTYQDDYLFQLQENKLFSNDYKAIIKKENTIEHKTLEELNFDGKYFINSDRSSKHLLAFSLFENQYNFYVKSAGKEFYIEPLRKFNNYASADEYVYYQVKDIINDVDLNCGVQDKSIAEFHYEKSQSLQPNDGCKTLELNFCVDYSFYANNNYSINASINKTLEIMNSCQLDFTIANGLDYDVNFKLKRHYIITCTGCNYWPTTGDLTTNHSAFTQFENYTQIFDTKADVKVFWEYSTQTQTAFGYGSQGVLTYCDPTWTLTTRGTASIRHVGDSNFSRKVFSHELGHNYDCEHIQDGNNIMNSGGYAGHYWNPASVDIINNTLASSECFSDCQAELCENQKVENLTVTVDSSNSIINVNWLSEIGMEYKLRLYTYNTNTWSNYSTVSYPQNSFALPYTDTVLCGNRYKVEIVPVCSGMNGFAQLIVLYTNNPATYPGLSFQSTTQTQTLCLGYTYTFSVHSIYPGTNPIYQWKINGIPVGTNSPVFTTSTLQNNNQLTCQVISNDPCLTNPSSTVVVTVSVSSSFPCTLSNTEFEIGNIDFYPNPVKNNFTIKAQTEIKSISIFNLLGQKLLDKSVENTETVLDLSNLSISTYFVKIEFDGFSKTIKVIKE